MVVRSPRPLAPLAQAVQQGRRGAKRDEKCEAIERGLVAHGKVSTAFMGAWAPLLEAADAAVGKSLKGPELPSHQACGDAAAAMAALPQISAADGARFFAPMQRALEKHPDACATANLAHARLVQLRMVADRKPQLALLHAVLSETTRLCAQRGQAAVFARLSDPSGRRAFLREAGEALAAVCALSATLANMGLLDATLGVGCVGGER